MRTSVLLLAAAASALATTSCGDDVQESSDLGDLSAVWDFSSTVISNTCGLEDGSRSTDRIILINCGNEVSVIAGSGLWGTGVVQANTMELDGTELQKDGTGCRSTHHSTGTVLGTSTLLTGTITTDVSFHPDSCGGRSACSVESAVRLDFPTPYTSCLGRDRFGDPAVSPYVLPFPAGQSYKLNNSYCVPSGGHREQQAYDFLIPIGDTIVAARAGVVREVEEGSPDNGMGSDHNHVMIEHADGTVGFYAHLMQSGVLVQIGDDVQPGQPLALAGHSGTTDVVHLHFGVYSSYPPVEGDDRAVNFKNMEGPLDCRGGLVNGATYTAQ